VPQTKKNKAKMLNSIRNEKILIIGFPAWEGDYLKSTVQLASELARENEVLYVEYPFTWKDVATGMIGKGKAPWQRVIGKEQRLRQLELANGASINVLTLPPMVPVNFINNEMMYDALMLGNAKRAFKAIQSAMQSLGIEKPVVINAFNPFLGVFLARQFDEKALIYYCYDEIGAAKWAGKHGARLEYRLMRQADAVVTTSQPLFESKMPHAHRSFLVKNGVDFDLFHQEPTPGKEQRSVKTIGYLGSLDERIDFDLLEYTIAKLPHRQFCFVGRVNSPEAGRLLQFPNVKIMGSQPASSLPGWVQQFDACMIPFLKNELTAGIYPLKINEYFAAGKPVVATNFGDLRDFQHLIGIAETKEEYPVLLEYILSNNSSTLTSTRIAFARHNSWQHRAAELGRAINTVLLETRQTAMHTTSTWMPDNFNRWCTVSEPFFKNKHKELSTQLRKKADEAYMLAATMV
jgi:glycosyltransferase involved in cell wall biosynthesis